MVANMTDGKTPPEGKGEYAQAGVDYTKLQPFKNAMVAVGKRTLAFPNARNVYMVTTRHSHGAVYEYSPPLDQRTGCSKVRWCKTQEGLGNKNWIAEWMYQETGEPHYEKIGIDTALMAVNDVIAQGAMPVVYADEVAAGDSEWFADTKRAADLANGFYKACAMCGMALGAGESPALRYLVNAKPPVKSAPTLSGSVTAIIAPASRLITGDELAAGNLILGFFSSGLHANGISLVIKRAMSLPNQFMTELPNGNSLGKEALIPTMSYVGLVESLLKKDVPIHALLPGTGDGIAKLAFDERDFTYRVFDWPAVIPPLFTYLADIGVSIKDCVTTFNMGIGYYAFVPASEANRALNVAADAGYAGMVVGRVEEGVRQTIVEPGLIWGNNRLSLPPPGE